MNGSINYTTDCIEQYLIKLFQNKGLKKYKFKIESKAEKGDNYMSDITFIKATYEENGQKIIKNLVIKCGKNSEELRELLPVKQSFENEIYMYKTVLPKFIEFQREKNIKNIFDNFPKFFGALFLDKMEVLAIENLKYDGYKLWDRRKPLPLDHIIEVIRIYGKLHALSFAMRDQKPKLFKQLTANLSDLLEEFEKLAQESEPRSFQDIIKLGKQLNDDDLVQKATLLQSEEQQISRLTDPDDPYAVILHGDCWNNNFMYKYEDKAQTKLSKVCLLDWQISRLASPVYDLSYFLFTCISNEDLIHFDKINEIYHRSLSDFLTQLGSDPEKLFPYAELKNQWRRFAKFGLIMMPNLIRLCLSDKDEIPDMAEHAEKGGEQLIDAFAYEVKNVQEYSKRTLGVMKLAISRGFIW